MRWEIPSAAYLSVVKRSGPPLRMLTMSRLHLSPRRSNVSRTMRQRSESCATTWDAVMGTSM